MRSPRRPHPPNRPGAEALRRRPAAPVLRRRFAVPQPGRALLDLADWKFHVLEDFVARLPADAAPALRELTDRARDVRAAQRECFKLAETREAARVLPELLAALDQLQDATVEARGAGVDQRTVRYVTGLGTAGAEAFVYVVDRNLLRALSQPDDGDERPELR